MTRVPTEWFDPPEPQPDDVMYVDVAGYEGPLDLLLDLARRQKVDLAAISVLALAEQYLNFIASLRERRIEVAADYLVMAAWLAYLKSRLMVPQAPSDEEPSGDMLAALLQLRLKRLEAMRAAAALLRNRPRLGVDVHERGEPDATVVDRHQSWEASLFDLLKAYSTIRERAVVDGYTPLQRTVWSLQEARDILVRLIGDSLDWVALDQYLANYLATPAQHATVRASSFSASLELARQGKIDLRQSQTFGPLFMRRHKPDGGGA